MSKLLTKTHKSENRISLLSLGCPKNLVDSDNLMRRLLCSGFSFRPSSEDADILLINTCGFIEDAKKESIEETLKLAALKNKTKKLIVFGCLAKRYKDEMIKEIPEIDAIFGVGEEDKIVEYCKGLVGQKSKSSDVNETKSKRSPNFLTSELLNFQTSYAYLKIAEGCNKRCTYCVIPSIRGKYKSIRPAEITKEAERLINAGAKELILVAQDTACYGKDLNGADIPELLKELCLLSGDFRIRLLYAYPSSINDSLVRTIAEEDKICKYLDIPFQHSEDRILRLMGRKGTRKEYLKLISDIRRAMPDVALRTTFIVGFPSETEREFNAMLDFIEGAQFDRLGAFKYSKEEGTPAAKLKGQLTKTVKNRRHDKIMRHQSVISLEKNKNLIGKTFKALIDEVSDGIAIGRLYSHAPEIDGMVIIESSKLKNKISKNLTLDTCNLPPVKAGDFVDVEITDAFEYDLKGILPDKEQSSKFHGTGR